LAADEGEAGTELGEELGQLGDEGILKVPLVVVGMQGQEVQVVGVGDQLAGQVGVDAPRLELAKLLGALPRRL